jgi:hypothetical protein
MSWQRSLQTAVRTLRTEETALLKRLERLRTKIQELEAMAKEGDVGGRVRPTGRRRLSPAGRAAISKAAKKRWQKYRTDKAKRTRRRAR